MMRVSFGVVFALVAVIAPLHAQSPSSALALTPAPPDFYIDGYIDRVEVVPGSGRVVLLGWAFECRSGLQPATQRLGAFSVHFTAPGQSNVIPATMTIGIGERPDVAAVYEPYCPAVGQHVCYAITVPAPSAGVWTARLSWVTWDGAGRIALHNDARTVTVPASSIEQR